MNKGLNRGCGTRKAGAIYAVSDQVKHEEEDFLDLSFMLVCPPWIPWEESVHDIGLSARGMLVRERINPDGTRTGIWDLWDWIGEAYYPYFPDFYEEAIRFGTSRLIPSTIPFKLLSEDSRHLFIHPKAIIDEPKPFYVDRMPIRTCPHGIGLHDHPILEHNIYDHCVSLLWESIGEYKTRREILREFPVHLDKDQTPTFSYKALTCPEGAKVEWRPAVVMWDYIERFEIVEDDIDKKHERALGLIDNSGTNIPYMLVTE